MKGIQCFKLPLRARPLTCTAALGSLDVLEMHVLGPCQACLVENWGRQHRGPTRSPGGADPRDSGSHWPAPQAATGKNDQGLSTPGRSRSHQVVILDQPGPESVTQRKAEQGLDRLITEETQRPENRHFKLVTDRSPFSKKAPCGTECGFGLGASDSTVEVLQVPGSAHMARRPTPVTRHHRLHTPGLGPGCRNLCQHQL